MADEMVNSIGRRTLLSALSTAALGAAAMTSGKRVALANDQIVKTNAVVPSVCVFDVNETLLDIDSIAPLFQRIFGDRKAVREWFGQLILYSAIVQLYIRRKRQAEFYRYNNVLVLHIVFENTVAVIKIAILFHKGFEFA